MKCRAGSHRRAELEKLVFRLQSALEGLVDAIYNADRTVIGGNHTSEDQLGLIYQRGESLRRT